MFGEDGNDDTYQYDFDDADDYLREDEGYNTFVQYRDEIELNNMDDSCIPRHVPWLSSWCNLVDTIRRLERPSFWEMFAGQAEMTKAFRDIGICCAPPLDAASNPDFNLLDAGFLAVVLGIIGAHLVDLTHLAPPCSTFSVMLNGFLHSMLRSAEYPGGLPNLTADKAYKVRLGNSLAEIAAAIYGAQHAAGNLHQLEQPGKSLMSEFEPVRKVLD